jgi:hypothetical protein
MVVLQQLVNNIPVPDTYTTISLTEFISRALKAYNIISNYHPHLEHLPILPHLGYETLTWPDVIDAVRKVPPFFLPNTLENMYNNVMDLMSQGGGSSSGSGSSSSGSGSSGDDYDARIEALETEIIKIPTKFTINTLPIMKEDVRVMKEKFTYIPSYNSFNVQAWNNVVNVVVKIPSDFQSTTLQELYDYVDNLKNNIPNTDSFNVDTWKFFCSSVNNLCDICCKNIY